MQQVYKFKYKRISDIQITNFITTATCQDIQTGQLKIMKIIKGQKKKVHQYIQQIQLLSSLQHPNLIKVYDKFQTECPLQINQKGQVFKPRKFIAILETIEGQPLKKWLPLLNQRQMLKVYLSLKSLLEYIHSKKIVIENLNSQNLVLNKEFDVIMIGLKKLLDLNDTNDKHFFNAPQLNYVNDQKTNKVDYWSVGMILFEYTLKGKQLSQLAFEPKNSEIITYFLKDSVFKKCNIIIKQLLKNNPEERKLVNLDEQLQPKIEKKQISLGTSEIFSYSTDRLQLKQNSQSIEKFNNIQFDVQKRQPKHIIYTKQKQKINHKKNYFKCIQNIDKKTILLSFLILFSIALSLLFINKNIFQFFVTTLTDHSQQYYFNIAQDQYKSRQFSQAIQSYTDAININPNFYQAYKKRGLTYLQFNKYQLAFQDFNTNVLLKPNFYQSYCNRGRSYYKLKQYHHAIEDQNKSIQLNQKFAQPYQVLTLVELSLKKYQSALNKINIAINLNPQSSPAYLIRGKIYLLKQNLQLAQKDFNRAIELDKNNFQAYCERAKIRYQQKKYQQAIQDLKKSLQINNKFAESYELRAKIQEHQKKYERALQDYTMAIQLEPKEIYYKNRGQFYKLLKKNDLYKQDNQKGILMANEDKI